MRYSWYITLLVWISLGLVLSMLPLFIKISITGIALIYWIRFCYKHPHIKNGTGLFSVIFIFYSTWVSCIIMWLIFLIKRY